MKEEKSHINLCRKAFVKIQHNKNSQKNRNRRELTQPDKEHLEKKKPTTIPPETGKKAKMSPQSHSR